MKRYFAIKNSKEEILDILYDNRYKTTYIDVYDGSIDSIGRCLFSNKDSAKYELDELKLGNRYKFESEGLENDVDNFKIIELEIEFKITIK